MFQQEPHISYRATLAVDIAGQQRVKVIPQLENLCLGVEFLMFNFVASGILNQGEGGDGTRGGEYRNVDNTSSI